MAEKVADYEGLHVSFNYTIFNPPIECICRWRQRPLLGVTKTCLNLTEADKRFILERFYDVNWTNIIARYPRYQALLDQRGGTDEESIQVALSAFTEQDFRDLQIWFNWLV